MSLDDCSFSRDGAGVVHLAAILTCASCAQLSATTEGEAIERSRRIFEQHYAYLLSKHLEYSDAVRTPAMGRTSFVNKKNG